MPRMTARNAEELCYWMNVNLPGVSLVCGSLRTEVNRAFPVNVTICKWRPKAYQVRKALLLLAPLWLARCSRYYLRHDDAKWPDFAERQKMNTRQIIEVLKRRIKSGVMMLGASSTVRARAFGDGPDRAAVSTLKQVRAFVERVPDVITRG